MMLDRGRREEDQDALERDQRLGRCSARRLRHRIARHGGGAEEEELGVDASQF